MDQNVNGQEKELAQLRINLREEQVPFSMIWSCKGSWSVQISMWTSPHTVA